MCDGKTRNAYFLWRNVIFNTSPLFQKKLLCFNARISNKAICSFVLVNVCLNSTFHPLCKTYQSKCKILGVTFANYRIQIEHVRCLILVQIKYATCYVTGKISSDVETTGCLEKKKDSACILYSKFQNSNRSAMERNFCVPLQACRLIFRSIVRRTERQCSRGFRMYQKGVCFAVCSNHGCILVRIVFAGVSSNENKRWI